MSDQIDPLDIYNPDDTRGIETPPQRGEEYDRTRIPEEPLGRVGMLDGLYIRVTERSSSTLHPGPTDDYLTRVVEAWRREDVPDYRGLQHQLLGGVRLRAARASVRSHVGERHFLYASRQRVEFVARSDTRKTRAS